MDGKTVLWIIAMVVALFGFEVNVTDLGTGTTYRYELLGLVDVLRNWNVLN